MRKLDKQQHQRIVRWIYRNARPLELAIWQHHFEGAGPEPVLKALSAYQNEDGGFGNAVEADNWNPDSTPYSTGRVAILLDEIGFCDRRHPVVTGMLRYLDHTPDFTGKSWPAVIRSNDTAPHAPWWTWSEDISAWGYTPTLKLCGFILRFADAEAALMLQAESIISEAVDTYLHGTLADGSPYRSVNREGELEGFSYVLRHLDATRIDRLGDRVALRKALTGQASAFIERDPAKWASYSVRPSTLIDSPTCLFYPGNETVVEAEIDFLLDHRNADGVWNIIWSWGAYEKEFAIAENWWRGTLAIRHMLMFRNFDVIEGGISL